jgi:hypothetical protein
MDKNKIVIFYILVLVIHVAHIIEEVLGRFWLLNKIGLMWYITINVLLFFIPVTLFIFVLRNKPWAIKVSIVYAVFMALQGVGHNIGTMLSGKYFDGFAGGYTGIGLLVFGSSLIYYLMKGIKTANNKL